MCLPTIPNEKSEKWYKEHNANKDRETTYRNIFTIATFYISMKKHRFTNNKIQFQKHCNTQVFGLFLLWFTILFLHSCGIDRNIKKGEKFLAIGEYYDAATQFKTAYQRTPAKDRAQRGRLAAKMALCYDRISSS